LIDEETGDAILHDVAQTTDIGRNDRGATGLSL
jgi:hypothetical protein